MKLLLIEDEKELALSIQKYLTDKDFVCEWVYNKKDAIEKISIYDYDCILLDLMLPDGNGFDILKELKHQNKTEGIIIISANETLATRIEGFEIGADDYLTKPFHLSELLVRIQALIRRRYFKGSNIVSFNEIHIDILSKTVKVNNNKIDTTKKEIDLLLYLIGNENRVLSKSAIAEHLSGDMADMLDNHAVIDADRGGEAGTVNISHGDGVAVGTTKAEAAIFEDGLSKPAASLFTAHCLTCRWHIFLSALGSNARALCAAMAEFTLLNRLKRFCKTCSAPDPRRLFQCRACG